MSAAAAKARTWARTSSSWALFSFPGSAAPLAPPPFSPAVPCPAPRRPPRPRPRPRPRGSLPWGQSHKMKWSTTLCHLILKLFSHMQHKSYTPFTLFKPPGGLRLLRPSSAAKIFASSGLWGLEVSRPMLWFEMALMLLCDLSRNMMSESEICVT